MYQTISQLVALHHKLKKLERDGLVEKRSGIKSTATIEDVAMAEVGTSKSKVDIKDDSQEKPVKRRGDLESRESTKKNFIRQPSTLRAKHTHDNSDGTRNLSISRDAIIIFERENYYYSSLLIYLY